MESIQRNPLVLGILVAILLMTVISLVVATTILGSEVKTTPIYVTSTDYYAAATTATYVKSLKSIEITVKTLVAPTRTWTPVPLTAG